METCRCRSARTEDKWLQTESNREHANDRQSLSVVSAALPGAALNESLPLENVEHGVNDCCELDRLAERPPLRCSRLMLGDGRAQGDDVLVRVKCVPLAHLVHLMRWQGGLHGEHVRGPEQTLSSKKNIKSRQT